jgi:hypothetical protein
VLPASIRGMSAAYANLGAVLFASGRFEAWRENFRRFEAYCPRALPLAVQALEGSPVPR